MTMFITSIFRITFATATILVLAVTISAPVQASLIAHWKFDETSGTTAFDSAGIFDGTLQGATTFAPGRGIADGAIQLNSVNFEWFGKWN